MRSRLVRAALLLAVLPATAGAQGRPTTRDPIPAVLVDYTLNTLSPFGGELGITFTRGRAPDGWPPALIPAGAIVGGSTFGPMQNIIVSMPRSRDAERALTAQLLRAGYSPVDTTKLVAGEGFLGQTQPPRSARAYCADSGHALLVVPVDSTPRMRRVGVTLMGGSTGIVNVCVTTPRRAGAGVGFEPTLRIPALRAPLGVVVSSIGRNSSGNSLNLHASADTTLSATELATHYGRELQRAGWSMTEPLSGSRTVALQPLAARDSTGAEWRGALMIFTDRARRHLLLSVVGPPER